MTVAALAMPTANAATHTPKPKPTAKSSPVATKKATPTKKTTSKKKAKKKKKPLAPSPSPKWPPTGFKSNEEVFARIPTAKELIGIASNSDVITQQLGEIVDGVRICEKYSCGAVQLASLNGCSWWEVNGKLIGPSGIDNPTLKSFGTIRTLAKGSPAKKITTVLLISKESLALKHIVTQISAKCHHDPATETIPSSTYVSADN